MKKKIYFRADGNEKIGLGHIYRCIAFAEELNSEFEIYFLVQQPSDFLISELEKQKLNLIPLPSVSDYLIESIEVSRNILTEGDLIILDGYNFLTDVQKVYKNAGCKVISIDDIQLSHFYSDVVINHNPVFKFTDFDVEFYTKVFIGLRYSLIRKVFIREIIKQRIIKDNSAVFICLGGADPKNFTLKVLQACLNVPNIKKINIVTGGAYLHTDSLNKRIIGSKKEVIIYSKLDADKMVNLMYESSLAICSASTISFEIFCIGLNLITGYYVENQKAFASYIERENLGVSIGDFNKINVNELAIIIEKNMNADYYNLQKKVMRERSRNSLLEIVKELYNTKL